MSRNRVQHAYELLNAKIMWMAAQDLDENADRWFEALAKKLEDLGCTVPRFGVATKPGDVAL